MITEFFFEKIVGTAVELKSGNIPGVVIDLASEIVKRFANMTTNTAFKIIYENKGGGPFTVREYRDVAGLLWYNVYSDSGDLIRTIKND